MTAVVPVFARLLGRLNTRSPLTVLSTSLAVLVAYLMLRPEGPVGAYVKSVRQSAAQRTAVAHSWGKLNSEGGYLGASDANGRELVEFSDYQCPFCKRLQARLETLVVKEPSLVIRFRHFPLAGHPFARPAALASICAEGQARFASFHRRLFTVTRWEREPNWSREAQAAGIRDLRAFRRCLADTTTLRRLERDVALAESLRVTATPTLFSPFGRLQGFASDSALLGLALGQHERH